MYFLSLAGRCRGGLTSAGAPGVASAFRWATLCNHRPADKRPLVHSDPIYGPRGRFGPRFRPVTAQVRQSIASGHCVAAVIRQWCQDSGTIFFGFPTEYIVAGTEGWPFESNESQVRTCQEQNPTEFTRCEQPIESSKPGGAHVATRNLIRMEERQSKAGNQRTGHTVAELNSARPVTESGRFARTGLMMSSGQVGPTFEGEAVRQHQRVQQFAPALL